MLKGLSDGESHGESNDATSANRILPSLDQTSPRVWLIKMREDKIAKYKTHTYAIAVVTFLDERAGSRVSRQINSGSAGLEDLVDHTNPSSDEARQSVENGVSPEVQLLPPRHLKVLGEKEKVFATKLVILFILGHCLGSPQTNTGMYISLMSTLLTWLDL